MRIMQKRDMQMSAEAVGGSAGTNSRLMTVSGKNSDSYFVPVATLT